MCVREWMSVCVPVWMCVWQTASHSTTVVWGSSQVFLYFSLLRFSLPPPPYPPLSLYYSLLLPLGLSLNHDRLSPMTQSFLFRV